MALEAGAGGKTKSRMDRGGHEERLDSGFRRNDGFFAGCPVFLVIPAEAGIQETGLPRSATSRL
jgi:hypothetical protein